MATLGGAPDGEVIAVNDQHRPAGHRGVEIEIDGEKVRTPEREMTIAELLALVGLNPEHNYLIELKGRHQEKHEDPDEKVRLHPGMKFITGDRAPAPVA